MQNIGIILTSTVNVNHSKSHLVQIKAEDRIATYIKSVKQWLEHTPLRICLVENSGYSFPELKEEKEKYKDRFDVISYTENQLTNSQHLINNSSKGSSELLAINIAKQHGKIKDCLFFIKITARFFIPEFYNYLIENEFDKRVVYNGCSKTILGIRQNNADRCELLGCSERVFQFLFNPSLTDDLKRIHLHVESVYKHRFECLNQEMMFVCKEFKIEPTQRGGAPELYGTI